MFYVRTNDGVKIAVYDLNPTAAETVFLVHGWPLSHRIFEYQETPLICKGYRVVEIDLRGFGSSDKPACGYTYDRMADDIYAVVRALNLQNFTLAGYSMAARSSCATWPATAAMASKSSRCSRPPPPG